MPPQMKDFSEYISKKHVKSHLCRPAACLTNCEGESNSLIWRNLSRAVSFRHCGGFRATVNIYSPLMQVAPVWHGQKAGQLIVLVEKAHDINAKMYKSDISFLSMYPATTESDNPNISDECFFTTWGLRVDRPAAGGVCKPCVLPGAEARGCECSKQTREGVPWLLAVLYQCTAGVPLELLRGREQDILHFPARFGVVQKNISFFPVCAGFGSPSYSWSTKTILNTE
ncbi:hypothetical protein KIL84_014843 [Mauremys mutica]|uniref:Uncharacterized protein n=1 Tax=Mauremys mutica TaxID=74926 RepID=A0A9D4B147_9SAUR|nr:hypothetical protein KIL84_014843 [Mauremys mutica]